ncbi:MAG: hypothetical protein ABI624_05340 [Casimicrobiaceae bacterium]
MIVNTDSKYPTRRAYALLFKTAKFDLTVLPRAVSTSCGHAPASAHR